MLRPSFLDEFIKIKKYASSTARFCLSYGSSLL